MKRCRGVACLFLAALAVLPPHAAVQAQRQPVGETFEVLSESLPPPYATPAAGNMARRVARPDFVTLALPPGFKANAFATGLDDARNLLVAPNGDVLVAESGSGRITLLRDTDGDGVADVKSALASGLSRPHGMALHDGWLYVGEPGQVVRLPYRPGDLKAGGQAQPFTPPESLGSRIGNHWTRNILFSPDGRSLYVSVGSRSNTAEDPLPHASIQRFDADGGRQATYASGTRNPVGLAFNPATGQLWATVVERDGLGDRLPPDFLTRIVAGGFYGWPYAYAGTHPDPKFGSKRPDLVQQSILPDILFQAHSTPLGLVFYDGTMFPPDYRGDAFVSLHGSWNAAAPTGYMVARVRFRNGEPAGRGYETFASGFWLLGSEPARVWGRPVGLAVAADGALLIADDVSNSIWRVSYKP